MTSSHPLELIRKLSLDLREGMSVYASFKATGVEVFR